MKNIALYFGRKLREDDAERNKVMKVFYKEIMSSGIPRDIEMIYSGPYCDQLFLSVPDEYVQKFIHISNKTKGLCAKIDLGD